MSTLQERHDEHYIRAITSMGDSCPVVTSQAIFTSKKIKLVEKGILVDSSLFDRLVGHKLIPKIDHCLTVEGGVSAEGIRDYARELLDNDPEISILNDKSRRRKRMLRAFEEIPLLAPMAFKLTIACKQRPEVYDHSIRVALVALYLAIRGFFFSDKELSTLAAAAVFHDIGILHVSPELLRPGRRLKEEERHHLYAHPISAFLILREFSEYHPHISRTVFEHHERLDGSGYPRGLKVDEICLGAQILMLAEMANTIFERSRTTQSLAKFSVLLKLNRHKFHHELSQHLLSLVNEMKSGEMPADDEVSAFMAASNMEPRLVEVAGIFLDWDETRSPFLNGGHAAQGTNPLLFIIDERITDLQRMLLHAGFDMGDAAVLVEIMQDDSEALMELNMLLGETRWQLAEIVHEARRRMNDAGHCNDDGMAPVLDWCDRSEKVLERID